MLLLGEQRNFVSLMRLIMIVLFWMRFFAGRVLVWLRANRFSITSRSTLCSRLPAEFQPSDFDKLLWDEIRTRRQGSTESVGIFIAQMDNLFLRFNRLIPEEVKVNVVV